MNPKKLSDIQRLQTAMKLSTKRLLSFREHRVKALRQLVGRHYGEESSPDRVPVNLLELAHSTYVRSLVARRPQVTVTTKYRKLKALAKTLELAVNQLIEEIDLESTLSEAVTDAMVGVGIVKVGMAPYSSLNDPQVIGVRCNVGQPYAATISLDDWVHDTSARRYDQCSYAGHRYRLPYDYVMDSGLYENLDDLQATSKNRALSGGEAQAADIGRSLSASDEDEIYDYVELWDVWLPLENLILTLVHGDNRLPIRAVEWDGPETGPYRLLGFNKVSDQILPLPPVALWMDLHELANRVFLKLGRQADRQKTVLAYEGRAAEDVERLVQTSDGETIKVDSIDGIKDLKWGGPEQVNMAFMLQLINQFSWFAGNLDMLGGLSPQSETLGQDQLLAENASKRLQAMQASVLRFATGIVNDLAAYVWYDPLIEIPFTRRIESAGIEIEDSLPPELREGDFLQYNLKIEPYSMQYQTPDMRFNTLMGIMQQLVIPLGQQLTQQGVAIDFPALLERIGKLKGLEADLSDVLVPIDPNVAQQAGQPQQAGSFKPPQTMRTYQRVNRPAGTRVGRDNAMMQTLLGAGVQNDEIGAIGRHS